jgi:hypothetical protein
MKKKSFWQGFFSLTLVVAVIALMVSCGTPGAPKRAPKNGIWTSDRTGNVKFDNRSGLDADVYIREAYVRSVRKGTVVLVDVPGAEANGSQFTIKVYDHDKNIDINNPSEDALITPFTASLRPAGAIDPKNIRIPEPSYRDTPLTAGASMQDILVEFQYRSEIPTLGSVSAEVIRGQITTGKYLLSLDPQDPPVSVPMEPGFNQFTIRYTVFNNGKERHFFYPDWSNPKEANAPNTTFDATSLEPKYIIPSVGEIGTITWVGKEDNFAQLKVSNKSSTIVQVEVRDLGLGGREGRIELIALGALSGSGTLAANSAPVPFKMMPGSYRLMAKNARNPAITINTIPEIAMEPGTIYTWFITEEGGELNTTASATADLAKIIQNWLIKSDQPGAAVRISVESSDPDVKGFRDYEMGNTDSAGALRSTLSIANIIPSITYGNAAKVLIKITVEKDGFMPVTQAVNTLSLIQAGPTFTLDEFQLPKKADEQSAANWILEDVNWLD